jgi:hypothetical protein
MATKRPERKPQQAESPDRTKVSILCDRELSARLAGAATRRGITKSAFVVEVLTQALGGVRSYEVGSGEIVVSLPKRKPAKTNLVAPSQGPPAAPAAAPAPGAAA